MLTQSQAQRLAGAGLTAYNHNLDTSPEYYGKIITTRTYEDRLRTIDFVRKAGITVCCGGILGMGESDEDRVGLLHQLADLDPHPESVPINMLVRVEGTPLARVDLPILDSGGDHAAARIMLRFANPASAMSATRAAYHLLSLGEFNLYGAKPLTTANTGDATSSRRSRFKRRNQRAMLSR
jgi:biotin synthase